MSGQRGSRPAEARSGAGKRYRRGLETSILGNSTAFGFSVTVTVTFGSLNSLRGPPTVSEILLFVLGAGLAFAALQALATGGFRRRPRSDSSEVVLLGTAFNFVSIGLGTSAAVVVSYFIPYVAAWPLAAFVGAAVYVGAEATELALAETWQERHREAEDEQER